jgi:predicted transglutaminase-like cysteine proteinase
MGCVHWLWAWAIAALVLLAGPSGARALEPEGVPVPSILASLEIRSDGIQGFHKWRTMLERADIEQALEAAQPCSPGLFERCVLAEWDRFLKSLGGRDRFAQLVVVNQVMNGYSYISDRQNWGLEDHWATPKEFLSRFGDCEDYAIAKYFSLKRLGWPEESLRVVAVRDLERGVGHAVLVAFLGGRAWLLDNQMTEVTAIDRVARYQPIYSINEHHWWRHVTGAAPAVSLIEAEPPSGRRLEVAPGPAPDPR